MNIYAKTDYDGCEYITAGKMYDVDCFDKYGFNFYDDFGDVRYSQWNNSSCINGNNWTRVEAGTLNELDLHPGDVVELVDDYGRGEGCVGKKYTVYSKDTYSGSCTFKGDMWAERKDGGWVSHDAEWLFTIVSRAADTEEKPTLKVGQKYTSRNGTEWECISIHDGIAWMKYSDNKIAYAFNPDGTPKYLYDTYAIDLVKKPTRETVECFSVDGEYWDPERMSCAKYKITYDTIDGKPDWATLKGDDL